MIMSCECFQVNTWEWKTAFEIRKPTISERNHTRMYIISCHPFYRRMKHFRLIACSGRSHLGSHGHLIWAGTDCNPPWADVQGRRPSMKGAPSRRNPPVRSWFDMYHWPGMLNSHWMRKQTEKKIGFSLLSSSTNIYNNGWYDLVW